jgi:phage terminase small subunit
VTADRVIGELARIAFGNAAYLMRVGLDGEVGADLEGCTRDEAAALQEVTVEQLRARRVGKAQRGTRLKIKLADKRAALVDLGKHLGLFVDPGALNVNVANFFSERPPTMEEWQAEIEAQASEATVRK